MHLDSLTRPELIFTDLDGYDRATVLRSLAQRVVAQGVLTDAEELYRKLWEREQLGSTGIGSGVAIPHCKVEGLSEVILAIGRLLHGIDFGSVDGKPVRLLFLVVSPSNFPAAHLQCLAAISRWVKVEKNVEQVLALSDSQDIYRFLHVGKT